MCFPMLTISRKTAAKRIGYQLSFNSPAVTNKYQSVLNTKSSFWRRFIHSLLFVLVVGVGIGAFGYWQTYHSLPVQAADQPNPNLNYQGKLTNSAGTAVANGVQNVVFSIYNAASGGSTLWSESWNASTMFGTTVNTQAATGSTSIIYNDDVSEGNVYLYQTLYNVTRRDQVVIININTGTDTLTTSPTSKTWYATDAITTRLTTFDGLFSVRLPATSTLESIFNVASSTRLYLGMNFNNDGEMTPRKQITFAPLAINSLYVGGVASTSLARLEIANNFTAQNTFSVNPTGSGVGQGGLYINPTSPTADQTLLGIANNGSDRFKVDAEGDVFASGTLAVMGITTTSTDPLKVYGAASTGYVLLSSAVPAAYKSLIATSTNDLLVGDELSVTGIAGFNGQVQASSTLLVRGAATFYSVSTTLAAVSSTLVFDNGESITTGVDGVIRLRGTSTSYGSALDINFGSLNLTPLLNNVVGSSIYSSDNLVVNTSGNGIGFSNNVGITNSSTIGLSFSKNLWSPGQAAGDLTLDLTKAFPILYSTTGTVATTSIYDTLLVSSTDSMYLRSVVNNTNAAARLSLDDANDEFIIDVQSSSTAVGPLDVAIKLDDQAAGLSYFRVRNSSTAVWSVDSAGTVGTGGSDLAEKYPSLEVLAPGEVITIDSSNAGYVKRARGSPQEKIMGVVSTLPAYVMGYFTEGYQIALVGKVPVKVSDLNGPINVGDELTSSPLPGIAMRRGENGPVVGIALANLEQGEGKIMSFINVAQAAQSTQPTLPNVDELVTTSVLNDVLNGDLMLGGSSNNRLALNSTIFTGDTTGRAIALMVGDNQIGIKNNVTATLANQTAKGSLTVAGTALNGTSQTVVGQEVELRPEDVNDVGYGYKVTSQIGLGEQYGLYINLNSPSSNKWSVYVPIGGGRAYFGDSVAVGSPNERIIDESFTVKPGSLYVDDQLGVAESAYFNKSVNVAGAAYLNGGINLPQSVMVTRLPLRESAAEAGSVVVTDNDQGGARLSWQANANNILGVTVTSSTGIVGGSGGQLVVFSGSVAVKVSGENGPITKGDSLTTASLSGYAMKATLAEVGILGVALEDANLATSSATGQTMVMLAISTRQLNNVSYGINLSDLPSQKKLEVEKLLTEHGNLLVEEGATVPTSSLAVRQETIFGGDLRVKGLAILESDLVVRNITAVGQVTVHGLLRAADLQINGAVLTEFWDISDGLLQIGDAVTIAGPDAVDQTWADLTMPDPVNQPTSTTPIFRPAIGLVASIIPNDQISPADIQNYVQTVQAQGRTVDSSQLRRVKVAISGSVGGFSGLIPGQTYYLAARPLPIDPLATSTNQALSLIPPVGVDKASQVLGVARNDSQILLMPNLNYQIQGQSENLPSPTVIIPNVPVVTPPPAEKQETGNRKQETEYETENIEGQVDGNENVLSTPSEDIIIPPPVENIPVENPPAANPEPPATE